MERKGEPLGLLKGSGMLEWSGASEVAKVIDDGDVCGRHPQQV